jgi:hypothetical protein
MTQGPIRDGVIIQRLSGNLNLMLNELDSVSALARCAEVGDRSRGPYILNSTMAKLADRVSCVSRGTQAGANFTMAKMMEGGSTSESKQFLMFLEQPRKH